MSVTVRPPTVLGSHDWIITHLREQRQRSFLSQAEVARRIGVSRSAVNNWERGTSEPRVGHLQSYARAVGFQIVVAWVGPGRPAVAWPYAA